MFVFSEPMRREINRWMKIGLELEDAEAWSIQDG